MATHAQIKPHQGAWRTWLALSYGVACYLIFMGTTLYTIGFVGNLYTPKSIDTGRVVAPLGAAAIDAALLAVFTLQHSVMARPAFKQWWARIIPRAIERSTYVLLASLALLLLYWQWRPLPTIVWNVSNPVGRGLLLALYGVGWALVLLSTFLIDHSELFGLRQVYARWRDRDDGAPIFKTPMLYRLVRHPMMVGFLIAFWATPQMSVGHVLFSVAMTAYIVVGIHFEERDLLAYYGETYRCYQSRVRMLLPFPKR